MLTVTLFVVLFTNMVCYAQTVKAINRHDIDAKSDTFPNDINQIETDSLLLKSRHFTQLHKREAPVVREIWQKDSLPQFIFSVDSIPPFLRNDTLFRYVQLCKSLRVLKMVSLKSDIADLPVGKTSPSPRTPFLTIHGNVEYDYVYQSFVDTPYYQHELRQHNVRTRLNLLFKNKYPVNLNLSTRQSNSPYFINFLDLGFQFNRSEYERRAKQEIIQRVERRLWSKPELISLADSIKQVTEQLNDLRAFVQNPDVLQKLIEEREAEYYRRLELSGDSLQTRSTAVISRLPSGVPYKQFFKTQRRKDDPQKENEYSDFIAEQKKGIDSLEKKALSLKAKADHLSDSIRRQILSFRQKINKTSKIEEARELANGNEYVSEKRTTFEKILGNVRSIGVGRSMLNFSELTAWNVSLTGMSIEYTPKVYTAFAAGKIDYGFRDFLGKNTRQRSQHLIIGRFGIGDIEKKALILSVFTGKKYNYARSLSDTVTDHVPVTGFSLEGIWKKDAFTSLTAEVAKTTSPFAGSLDKRYSFNSLFNFSDRSNIGMVLKAQTIIRATDTRLSGFFRQTGENFQSFALFNYQTNQSAWVFKAEQSFFKDKIGLTAALRRNDFTNPFTEKTFRTSTIFKSVQLNTRFSKWPMISLSYHPGSQLYMIDEKRVREDAYYITNASLVYPYALGDLRMMSSVIYNNFSTKGTDSGFIAYSGKNYIATQHLLFDFGSIQGTYSYTDQAPMRFHTFEAGGKVAVHKILKVGGSAKLHQVPVGQSLWGGRAQVFLEVGVLGGLQLEYEKSYLPTIQSTLFPIEAGRLTWIKSF